VILVLPENLLIVNVLFRFVETANPVLRGIARKIVQYALVAAQMENAHLFLNVPRINF
jgi:hypothetical protein